MFRCISNGFQICHQGLKTSALRVAKTGSLEGCLKLIYKTIDFHGAVSLAMDHKPMMPLNHLSVRLREASEVLAAVQIFGLLDELLFPNRSGDYFLKSASWQKVTAKVSLFFYALLADLKLAERFGFISLGRLGKVSIGNLPVFKLVKDGFYAIYCFFKALESMKAKLWLRATSSIIKTSVVVLDLTLKMRSIKRTELTLLLLGLGVLGEGLGILG